MAMGRLLTPKLNPHFSIRGPVPLTRRWSSSSLEDGRTLERLPDSKPSANKDIVRKEMHWYSLGGLLSNLKQKIMGNMPPLLNNPPCVLSKPPMVEKVISLQNVAEDRNCIPPSAKEEESSISEGGGASQSVAAIEISGEREPSSVEKVMLDINSLEFAQEKVVLDLLKAEKVKLSSEDAFLGLVTEEALESNQGKLQSDKKVALSNMFVNLHPDKPRLRSEALSDSNSTRESSGDEVKNDQQRSSDALPSVAVHDLRERMTTFPVGSSRGTVVPVALSKDSSIRNLIVSLRKSNLFCAKEEKESKGLCSQSQATSAAATEKSSDALSIREDSPNKVVIRFLHGGFQKSDIVESFSEFGAVLDVHEVPSFEGCIYRDALVTFETKSAVKKALKKGVVMVKSCSAIVEATSQKEMVEKIRIPHLIGDPDVPVSLVKEPTRTVKIHPLDHNIGSNQIREALGFCKSDISKIIFGSSTTAAFVEFETQDGKERALAAHSVDVLNKQLFIARIDIPRTTVARISNLSESVTGELRELCVPYGQIRKMFHRGKGVTDVHFDVSEWPNMLTILNSMNGKERNGKKWVVRPATVIPHEILKVLWEDPQEKRYLKALIKDMVREIEQPLDAADLSSLCSALDD